MFDDEFLSVGTVAELEKSLFISPRVRRSESCLPLVQSDSFCHRR